MSETMEAVICRDFNDWTIESVPRPTPGPDEVLIDVDRVQLSVTECQRFRGEPISGREKIHTQMQEGDGRVFGHEFCGTVAETGRDVDSFAVGDRVYPPAKVPCSDCAYCRAGYRGLCPDKTSIGTGRPGALAESIAVPAEVLRTLPDGVSDAEGAAMQPLASAMLCTYDAGIEPGDVVAVIGAGVMGSQCGQLARLTGARTVFAIDVVAEKLAVADGLGMVALDPRNSDPIEEVRAATDGIGADVVFAAVGGDQSDMTAGDDPLAQAYRMVRNGGRILQVGHVLGEVTMTPRRMRDKSVRWINPRFGVRSLGPNTDTGDLAADLVADDRIVIEDYITHERAGLEAFGEAVDITVEKADYGALGPAQMVLS
ncbi:MAG: zinc-binding dehydrogenase [Halobacteriales archaeon]